eukprot:g35220.t1
MNTNGPQAACKCQASLTGILLRLSPEYCCILQIKYREEYEKTKGKSMMEFTETPSYEVAKQVQSIQSEKEYRKDFDEWIKGSVSVDLDMTPGYLHAKHVTSLLNE